MGDHRLFSRGGQNFSGVPGGKNILFALKTLKKHARPRGGGQEPPLALPCGLP